MSDKTDNWAIEQAVERLVNAGEGASMHLLGVGASKGLQERWLQEVSEGVEAAGGWTVHRAGSGGASAIESAKDRRDRWWSRAEAKAARKKGRTAVFVGSEAWERLMGSEDDIEIYALRARMQQAQRVHLVTTRAEKGSEGGSVHTRLARQRLEMTMTPCRTV